MSCLSIIVSQGSGIQDKLTVREPDPELLVVKKYNDRFMVRTPPELHRRLALEAAESGISLNRLAPDKLSRASS